MKFIRMNNINNAASFQYIQPAQHVAIQIEDDAAPLAPQRNEQPHPAKAIQNNRRPAWTKQWESLRHGGKRVTSGVAHAVNSVKDNPKPLLYAAAVTGALLLLASLKKGSADPHANGFNTVIRGGGGRGGDVERALGRAVGGAVGGTVGKVLGQAVRGRAGGKAGRVLGRAVGQAVGGMVTETPLSQRAP